MKSDQKFTDQLISKKYYGKLYWFSKDCREKAYQLLKNEAFLKYWDARVYGGEITISEKFHAGIDNGGYIDYNLEEFISEMGKRIFRRYFPESLRGFATKVWYNL